MATHNEAVRALRPRILEALGPYLRAVEARDSWFAHTAESDRGDALDREVEARREALQSICREVACNWWEAADLLGAGHG